MATGSRRTRSAPSKEVVAGVTVVQGTVLSNGRRLRVGKKVVDLAPGMLGTAKLAGKAVNVALSATDKSVVAISPMGRSFRWMTCYAPAQKRLVELDADVRKTLLDKMVKEKVITPEFAKLVTGG